MSVYIFLPLSVWLKVVQLSSLLTVCSEGCDRRVLECVVLLFSHFSLSISSSPTLAACLCVCVCCLLWSAALAQKRIPGRPILCSASCRKLAANCGSMRRCCFVWSDKVQTKPSGLHRAAAVLSIVDWSVNVGLCDGWLVLNIR